MAEKLKALIVGSNSDIGNAVVKELAGKYDIYTISRKKSKSPTHFQVENYSKDEVEKVYFEFKNKVGKLDVLIIMNGFGKSGKITEIPLDEIESMIQANLLVPYYFLHYFTRIFLENNDGRVVLIGSVAGIKYSPNYAMYSATKFAIRAIAEAYRNEYQNQNIRITNIQPGFVETKFWDEFGPNNSKLDFDKRISIHPKELAELIEYAVENKGSKFTINEITCRSIYQER